MYLFTDILLLGGSSRRFSKAFYSFSPSRQQWTKLPDLPTGKSYHNPLVIDNSLFIIGGCDYSTIQEYNISTKTFQNVVTMNKSGRHFEVCVFNKTQVLFAGGLVDNYRTTNSCFLFDTNTKTFKDIGNMTTKRCGHALVNLDGAVYSIGGYSKGEILNTIETFDLVTEQWKTSDVKLHIARYYHRAVAHKNCIYIIGGMYDYKSTDTIEKFNLLTGQIEILYVKRDGEMYF